MNMVSASLVRILPTSVFGVSKLSRNSRVSLSSLAVSRKCYSTLKVAELSVCLFLRTARCGVHTNHTNRDSFSSIRYVLW